MTLKRDAVVPFKNRPEFKKAADLFFVVVVLGIDTLVLTGHG